MQKALAESFASNGPDGNILEKKPHLQPVAKKLAKNADLQQTSEEKIQMIKDICAKYSTKSKSSKRGKKRIQIKQADIDDPTRILDHHNMILDNIYDRIDQAIEMATEELQIKSVNHENNNIIDELNPESDDEEIPLPRQAPQPISDDGSDVLKSSDTDDLEEEDLFAEESNDVNFVKH